MGMSMMATVHKIPVYHWSQTMRTSAAGAALLLLLGHRVIALDNGLGIRPPMAWRSWYAWFGSVNQTQMEAAFDAMASRTRLVAGRSAPASFVDLGYTRAGLDDNWQASGAGVNGSYHAANGMPLVNTTRFPDIGAMVAKARGLGIAAGWYMNNCIGSEGAKLTDPTFLDKALRGNVDAIVAFGFAGVKLDGCGALRNLTRWSELLNATGKHVLIEACHWGQTVPVGREEGPRVGQGPLGPSEENNCSGLGGAVGGCPYNLYRATGDTTNSFERIHSNIHGLLPFLGDPPLSRPGQWAHPDGLEVGRFSGPWALAEDQSTFGLYCITSSPLVLGHDIINESLNDRVWPVVSNEEAIAVNQDWAGHPGRLVRTWDDDRPSPAHNPEWPAGRAAYAVACEAHDGGDTTQMGWSFDTATKTLRKDGKCLDMRAADNHQLWLVACKSPPPAWQQWAFTNVNRSTGFGYLVNLQNHANLTTPGAQSSIGFARRGSKTTAMWRLDASTGQLVASSSGSSQLPPTCIAARSINPPAPNATFELWSKPLSGGKLAVFLLNNGLPANASFTLSDLGLGSSACARVRSIFAHKDLGTLDASGRFSVALGVHESVLLVLDLQQI